MCQDAPFNTDITVFEALASQGRSKVGVFEYADSCFGAAASFLQLTKIIVFKSSFELLNGTGADTIDNVLTFKILPIVLWINAEISSEEKIFSNRAMVLLDEGRAPSTSFVWVNH